MTLPLRRFVFWMHLVAGVSAGLVILVMSVTGVILAYEKQITRWADGVSGPPAAPGQARLPIDDLVARASAVNPGLTAGAITLRRQADAPVEITFGPKGTVFVHAYTGEVLGTGSARTRAFFRAVMGWHRWIALEDARRATGKAITGASNLIFLFIVLSGFYLWWPRAWTWTQFRQVLWFRRGLPSKARDFNWHHVIGYWSLVPLAVIVWSGAVIGYPWASDLTFRMAGEAPPPRAGQGGPARAGEPSARGPGERSAQGLAPGAARAPGERPAGSADRQPGESRTYLPLTTLLDRAAAQSTEWTILTARLPAPHDGVFQVTVDTGTGAQPQKKGTLQLDRATGETKKWEPFEAQSKGRQWRSWMRFAHTGEYYGLIGQTIACLVTAGSVVLAYTGLALTWRRLRAWRARKPAATRKAA
ncbi:putative iron-regulated membrane protein [Luteitalea pratensis]|uniref:Putative iron-regulated membrane protein n=1 Tax=Luteitalea pratensis TaxID=1855912 RepID=A0A143PGE4_LUTPR|nr:PepSY-associated TM helix domain-containing protein [Luteitalea pratensis]AMY07138.1 putative iron-regulated membrane protein [Luteitalea pratensis]